MKYRSFIALLRSNSLWISCIMLSALLFFVTFIYAPVPPAEGARNMLFTITQGLTTIIALAIPIPLIAAQMSARYSMSALDIVFSKKTTLYFIWIIFSAIYPLLASGSLTLYTTRAAIGFMISCLVLLIPYFYEMKEKLKPENLLKALGKKATKEVEKALSKITLPQEPLPAFLGINSKLIEIDDLAKGIHDAVISAYHRNEYDIFELGLAELNNLIETVYIKRKIIAKQFAGPLSSEMMVEPPIKKRFLMIGEDVIENAYAFDILVRKLDYLSYNALEKEIPELAKLTIYMLGLLGYHAIDKKLHTPFESIVRRVAFYSLSRVIDRKESELAKFIVTFVEHLGRNAIYKETSELVKPIAKALGDIGPSTIENNEPESKLIAEQLLSLGSYAADKGEFEISAICVTKIFVFSACPLDGNLKKMILDEMGREPLSEVLRQRSLSIIKTAKEEIKSRRMNLDNFNQFIKYLS